jgi:hypothetical protein
MRITLPPIDKIRPFQVLRHFFMDSIIGSHMDLLLGLAPTGIPRKQKGIDSMTQYKKLMWQHSIRLNLRLAFN